MDENSNHTTAEKYSDSLAARSDSERSLPRGCGYGCLYAGCAWIAVGILADRIVKMIAPVFGFTQREFGEIFNHIGFWGIVLPVGIFGLIVHWQKDFKK